MTRFLHRTGRYAVVGLLCALLNNAIVIGMDRFHIHYAVSVMAAYFVVTVAGYLLHAAYTFRVNASLKGWLRFASANLSGFPLAMGSMFVLCNLLGLRVAIAMPVATALLFIWNYALAYLVVGRPTPATRLTS